MTVHEYPRDHGSLGNLDKDHHPYVKRAGDTMTGLLTIDGEGVAPTLPVNSRAPTDTNANYPMGVSLMEVSNDTRWPDHYGLLVSTQHPDSPVVHQTYFAGSYGTSTVSAPTWYRRWKSAENAWTPWTPITSPAVGRWRANVLQSIPNAVETTIVYNETAFVHNWQSTFSMDLSTGVLKVSVAGIYEFGGSVTWGTTDMNQRYARIKHGVNNDASAGTGVDSPTANVGHNLATGPISVAAGDTVQMYVYQNSGAAQSLAAPYARFWAKRVA